MTIETSGSAPVMSQELPAIDGRHTLVVKTIL